MGRKARMATEEIARRTERLVSQGLPPDGEARGLIGLTGKADDRDFWRGLEPTPDEVLDVFAPALDRLVELGGATVDAVLGLDPSRDSWQADLAIGVLAHLLREGVGADRVGDEVLWGLRSELKQGEGFLETMDEVLSLAGPASEEPLMRFLEEHDDAEKAAALVSFALRDADPEWACGAATRMTRWALANDGTASRADVLSYSAAAACGEGAAPLVLEVAGRVAAEGIARDAWLPGAVDASLMLGVHPGPAWEDVLDDLLQGRTLEEAAGGFDDDELLEAVSWGASGHSRRDLARACRLMGLDDGGSKIEILERLEGTDDSKGPDLLGRRPTSRLEDLPTSQLRDMCEKFRLDADGPREDLLGRLRGLQATVGPGNGKGRVYTRLELDAMSSERLRDISEAWDLDPGGKRRALVARIQMAQEEGRD